MKKTLLLITLLLCLNARETKAQTWVTIPDANFVSYLQSIVPSAMSGNQLDTSNVLVTTTTHKISVANQSISDLTGVQYFKSLDTLSCGGNYITSIPTLPNSLVFLDCNDQYYGNYTLHGLPILPNSLTYLNCNNNALWNLPTLPNSLQYLYCINSGLHNLPAVLPDSLISLNCSNNAIPGLPTLPNLLDTLICYNNTLTSLPTLPNSLIYLDFNENRVSILPALPSTLTYLNCFENYLTALPTLSSSLIYLDCGDNSISVLPALPNSLQNLSCNANSLTTLPALPASLTYLDCSRNSIPSLPSLPNSLTYLDCDQQYSGVSSSYVLSSLPPLPTSLSYLDCYSNAITNIPALPSSLTYLNCCANLLTSLPPLPDSLHSLFCQNNQITCFPKIPSAIYPPTFWAAPNIYNYYINVSSNPFTCLPNHIAVMDSTTLAIPLCAAGNVNGCPITDTCSPYITFVLTKDTSQPYTWDAYPTYSSNITNVRWYWGDSSSTNSLYPSHTYSSQGRYNICVTAYSSCGDSTTYCQNDSVYRYANNSTYSNMIYVNVLHIQTTGINQLIVNNTQVKIYPNPANGTIHIEMKETGEAKLCDLLGNELLTTKENEMDVSGLSNGVYFVHVNKYIQKVIVQH